MKQDREQELMTRLSIVQKLSLAEAMELLGISESTARRMFSNWTGRLRDSDPRRCAVCEPRHDSSIPLNTGSRNKY